MEVPQDVYTLMPGEEPPAQSENTPPATTAAAEGRVSFELNPETGVSEVTILADGLAITYHQSAWESRPYHYADLGSNHQ